MRLSRFLREHLPPRISEEIQGYMIFLGIAGVILAPFLPTRIGVIVINVVSMLTLTITGLAGVDAARSNGGEKHGERQ